MSLLEEYMVYKAISDLLSGPSSEVSEKVYRRIRVSESVFDVYKFVDEAALMMKLPKG
jgi:hypothetical protein